METSFCYCPLDAYEGERTHRYSKGQTDYDPLNKQTDIHAAPETVKNDGYQTREEGEGCNCSTSSGPVPVLVMRLS
jgi:hypothetical protein